MDIQVFHENLDRHRRFYLFEGILFVVLGILAILVPAATAVAFNIIVAVALIVGGFARLSTGSRRTRDSTWKFLGGGLLLATGILMLFFPEQGIAVIVAVLAAFLILEGGLTIALGRLYRGFPGSGWIMVSGVVDLILGLIVLILFPEAGVIYLAVMLGLSLLMSGISMLLLVRGAGRA